MNANTNIDTQDHSTNHIDSKIGQSKDFLTIIIAGQRFGIAILQVQDILGNQSITKIPLAPPEVAGSLNLRGRIVTAIDVRCRLGIEPHKRQKDEKEMSVVVDYKNELYSLIIDSVGDVMTLQNKDFEKTPITLDTIWQEISLGIYQLDEELLIILDVAKLLDTAQN